MRTVEEYMEHLKTLEEAYHWPIKALEERKDKRAALHEEFPYVVTYEGCYGHGTQLDAMDAWCREKFGDAHGECHWRDCELSWYTWYEKNNFDEELDKLIDEKAGKRPAKKKKKAWKEWQKINDVLLDEHFKMIEERPDRPEPHSHKGIWTNYFVVKTGYDYGYQDYCFKNPEDAFYFKIMWDGEQK